MTYSEKLRDPRWQKKRLEIFNRDGFQCAACGKNDRTLTVHHIVYARRDPWDYPDWCYQTLCEDCHEIRQELADKIANATRLRVNRLSTDAMLAEANRLMAEGMEAIPA